MKIATMLAALGLATAIVPLGAAASAQSYRGDHWNNGRWDHDRGRDHRYRRWDNGRAYAYGYGYGYRHRDYRPRCWTEWRHHHRVRVCR